MQGDLLERVTLYAGFLQLGLQDLYFVFQLADDLRDFSFFLQQQLSHDHGTFVSVVQTIRANHCNTAK